MQSVLFHYHQGSLTEEEGSVHLTSLYKLVYISCFSSWSWLFVLFKKTLMRRSIVLSLPFQQEFPDWHVQRLICLTPTFNKPYNGSLNNKGKGIKGGGGKGGGGNCGRGNKTRGKKVKRPEWDWNFKWKSSWGQCYKTFGIVTYCHSTVTL
jgi:hypothetical protein